MRCGAQSCSTGQNIINKKHFRTSYQMRPSPIGFDRSSQLFRPRFRAQSLEPPQTSRAHQQIGTKRNT